MAYTKIDNSVSLADWYKYNQHDINATEALYRFHEPKNNATIFYSGEDEILRVAEDGFYVRGKKIPVDDKEAETVYNAFKQWLAWANLQQQR